MRGGQLDLARGQGGVVGAFIPQAYFARDFYHALVFEPFGGGKALRVHPAQVEHGLQRALPVAHVHKDHAAHVAAGKRPAAYGGRLADVLAAQRAAVMRSFHKPAASLFQGRKKAFRPDLPGRKACYFSNLPRYHPLWTFPSHSNRKPVDFPALYRARPSAPTQAQGPLGRMLRGVLHRPKPAAFPAPAALLRASCGRLLSPSLPCAELYRGKKALSREAAAQDKKSAAFAKSAYVW